MGTRSVGQVGTLDRNAGSPGGGQPRQPFFGLYGRTAPTSQIVGLGNDKYDALQSKLGRRFASGYQVAFAYTFSKTLGIAGDQNNGSPLINL
ncbi:MAG: hypothetical protein ABI165_19615, partial [Bryobacteraceae bacterium]